MEIYGFEDLKRSREKKNCAMAIAIGVFDGVHLGHQKIFSTLKRVSDEMKIESMCITFDRNPKSRSQGNLDTMRLREKYVSSFQINSFTIIDFSENFSKISAWGFASSLLELCKPRVLVVGSDFKCGNPNESADGEGMKKIFASLGVDILVKIVDFVMSSNGEKISSTLLRQLVKDGDLESYSRFSGQGYHIDLLTEPSRENGALAFSRDQIYQILPPPGSYKGRLLSRDGDMLETLISITSDNLLIESVPDSWQADSIYIFRRM